MDAKQLFFERYEGYREYPEHLIRGLSESQLRYSSHASLNPIVWTLWHIARCEDVGVNRVLSDQVQVLDEDDWASRLRVEDRGVGTGMSKATVIQLSEAISLPQLEGYREAVAARTRVTIAALPLEELSRELDLDRLRRVFVDEEAGGSVANEIVEAYRGHTAGWLLGHLVLTHHYYHIGQAFGVRAMFGVPNPW